MIEAIKLWLRQKRCDHGTHVVCFAENGVIASQAVCPKCGVSVPNIHRISIDEQHHWFKKSKDLGPGVRTILFEYNSQDPQNAPQTIDE